MDDLLVFWDWDEERFLSDIENHCYLLPLKLEAGKEGTFLERTKSWFHIGSKMTTRLERSRGPNAMRISTAAVNSSRSAQCSWHACKRYKRWRAMGMRYG